MLRHLESSQLLIAGSAWADGSGHLNIAKYGDLAQCFMTFTGKKYFPIFRYSFLYIRQVGNKPHLITEVSFGTRVKNSLGT